MNIDLNQYTAENIEQLRSQIRHYAKAYYVDDAPLVSDEQYNLLLLKLEQLEAANPHLITPDSPTLQVNSGVKEGFQLRKHIYPMISLATITNNDIHSLGNWYTEMEKFVQSQVDNDPLVVVGEYKFDGLALNILYINGQLAHACTRGDTEYGEDVTANAIHIGNLPLTLPNLDILQYPIIEVRGEVLLSTTNFDEMNDGLYRQNKKPLANPRNAAAGILRRTKNANKVDLGFLDFIAYDICAHKTVPTQAAVTLFLGNLGFWTSKTTPLWNFAEVLEWFDEVTKARDAQEIKYEIDGVVFKVDDREWQRRLGATQREPRWARAYKFAPREASTVIERIEFSVGRTGVITPVAQVIPVSIGGVTITNVSLKNKFEIRRLGVRVGSTVLIRRAGDVIPEVAACLSGPPPWVSAWHQPQFPNVCPSCQAPLVRYPGERKIYCSNWPNNSCRDTGKARLLHMCSKNALDLQGFGPATIDNIWDRGIARDMATFLSMTLPQVVLAVGGYELAGARIYKELERVRAGVPLWRFISAMGIESVGSSTAKYLAHHFKTVNAFVSGTVQQFMRLKDIGPTTAKQIHTFLVNQDLPKLLSVVKIIPAGEAIKEGPMVGMEIVLTGTFSIGDRDHIKDLLERKGAIVRGSVSRKTNILTVGYSPAKSKVTIARNLKIQTWTEQQLRTAIAFAEVLDK